MQIKVTIELKSGKKKYERAKTTVIQLDSDNFDDIVLNDLIRSATSSMLYNYQAEMLAEEIRKASAPAESKNKQLLLPFPALPLSA